MKILNKTRSGFTLIEMTVVLFIISLLILIILPNISRSRRRALEIHEKAMVSVIKTQSDAYMSNERQSTVDLSKLMESHYLSESQVSRAKKYGIDIKDNAIFDHDKKVENLE